MELEAEESLLGARLDAIGHVEEGGAAVAAQPHDAAGLLEHPEGVMRV